MKLEIREQVVALSLNSKNADFYLKQSCEFFSLELPSFSTFHFKRLFFFFFLTLETFFQTFSFHLVFNV